MEQDIINRVRTYYGLPDSVSDRDISNNLNGSLGHSSACFNKFISVITLEIKESLLFRMLC